ncbi:hypothetical protein PR048_008983 [Dryococelus australis]|uniref:Uncharacterized protein n=1 Tax=Dryococelus australis TaxID=614101 RepID=A0ABQ9HYM7_9NEOP|nr:hypothetical protein PR048_008983 [Dryococelus australis]
MLAALNPARASKSKYARRRIQNRCILTSQPHVRRATVLLSTGTAYNVFRLRDGGCADKARPSRHERRLSAALSYSRVNQPVVLLYSFFQRIWWK